ncbi:MAG: hypothetical protein IJ371_06275 [Clostridia bacterium]|nr:hypothetical protein [Clostridia bacterium]
MEEYNNQKAIDFFGEEIVENLETQHLDNYPKFYKKISYKQWQFGDIAEYIVPFKDKQYKVRVEDNVAKNPLYINQIVDWEEIK